MTKDNSTGNDKKRHSGNNTWKYFEQTPKKKKKNYYMEASKTCTVFTMARALIENQNINYESLRELGPKAVVEIYGGTPHAFALSWRDEMGKNPIKRGIRSTVDNAYGLLISASYNKTTGPTLQKLLTSNVIAPILVGFQDAAIEEINQNPQLAKSLESRLQTMQEQPYFQDNNFNPNFQAAYTGLRNPTESTLNSRFKNNVLYTLGKAARKIQFKALGLNPKGFYEQKPLLESTV